MSTLLKTTLSTRILLNSLRMMGRRQLEEVAENGKGKTAKDIKLLVRERTQRLEERQIKDENNKAELDSLLAERLVGSNVEEFGSIHRYNRAGSESKAVLDKKDTDERASFPYRLKTDDELFKFTSFETGGENDTETTEVMPDKGFFVQGDVYKDEYIAATATDLPEDEMNEYPFHFVGGDDAVETISFQLPGQASSHPKQVSGSNGNLEEDDDDWKANYSSEDLNVAQKLQSGCSGCGANLHCRDNALPGYVPFQIYEKVLDLEQKNARRKNKVEIDELCRRCYMLKNHNFLLNVNVCGVDYEKLMGHLKLVQEALLLLVVDMTDIRGSIYRQLPDIVGDAKPMIVIGNKVDLLPSDAKPGYLKRYKDVLLQELHDSGLSRRFNVLHTSLVSAKTGYGVEDLITNVYLKWMNSRGNLRSDIYVVGCTNAGKSTLFNAFLQSDLCKVRAMDLIERVTTSVWPGTTLSLLKFPLMNPSSYKLELRRRRLLSMRAWTKKEDSVRHSLYKHTSNPKYLTLSGYVDNTFKDKMDGSQPSSNKVINATISHSIDMETMMGNDEKPVKHNVKLTDVEFTKGHWCFDTPGTVNSEQLLDLYTLDELVTLIPRSLIMPRIFVVQAGESLLFGGTARIDVVETEKPVFLTVYCSDKLPLAVMTTDKVEEYCVRNRGTEVLAVPNGNEERLNSFPGLKGESFTHAATSSEEAACDLVMSSIGWTAVSGGEGQVKVHVSTPDGRGISTRNPLLLYGSKYRSKRMPGKSEYSVKALFFEAEEDAGRKENKFKNRNRNRR